MSGFDEIWSTRLHAAVDDHPGATTFDVPSYVAAGRRRSRRRRVTALLGSAAAVVAVIAGVAALGSPGDQPRPLPPTGPDILPLGPATNGWVAVDVEHPGGDVYLARFGQKRRLLDVGGSETARVACPVWSPDGTKLLVGRLTATGEAALVVVPVGRDGAPGNPTTIELDGFGVLDDFDPRPCGLWAPDGRWVALAAADEVWVVDTRTSEIRRLPDLRPSDLEWRPGTDELTIAGDLGDYRAAPTLSAPVRTYTVSTAELSRLGAVEASHVTWSPDGATLAYSGGDGDATDLRLVDADGGNERLLAELGPSIHGIGPAWSPAGDRIAYQRMMTATTERHVVVLLDVDDGTETVIDVPVVRGRWYPFAVAWSPDGNMLVYVAWGGGSEGVIAVVADEPGATTPLLLGVSLTADFYSHRWAPTQMWGRLAPVR